MIAILSVEPLKFGRGHVASLSRMAVGRPINEVISQSRT